MLQNVQRRFLGKIIDLASEPEDDADARLRKALLLGACFAFVPIVLPYVIIYSAYGERLPAAISFTYFILSFIGVAVFMVTRRFNLLLLLQQLLVLFSPFLFLVALGGYANSSAVIIWAVICPLGTLVISKPEGARRWLGAYLALVALSALLQPFLGSVQNLPDGIVNLFFALNIGGVSTMVFILLYYFVIEKDRAYRLLHLEQEKSENLLLNVLPKEIASILKDEERTIAENYPSASVLFADLVGFTPLSARLAPTEMVELLNEIFSYFDSLADKYDLEKIRTIGDNYMVAAGVPRPKPDHCKVMANMALDMQDYIHRLQAQDGLEINFRIGMNSGPVVGGVIGRRKFHFDIWGDTVNIASRMESHGEAGKIQVTREVKELLEEQFTCEPRGTIIVKGRGKMETWFLTGRKTL